MSRTRDCRIGFRTAAKKMSLPVSFLDEMSAVAVEGAVDRDHRISHRSRLPKCTRRHVDHGLAWKIRLNGKHAEKTVVSAMIAISAQRERDELLEISLDAGYEATPNGPADA